MIKENLVRIVGVLVFLATIAVAVAAPIYELSGGHTPS